MFVRAILALLAAAIVTEVTTVLISSNSVMLRLLDLGVEIPPALWLSTIVQDVFGVGVLLLPVTLIGFAIAFTVARVVEQRLLPGWAAIGYPLAGAVTMALVLFALNQIFLTHPIPAARTLVGKVLLLAGGAGGGWVFHFLAFRRSEGAPAT